MSWYAFLLLLLYLYPHVVWNGYILFFNRSFFFSFRCLTFEVTALAMAGVTVLTTAGVAGLPGHAGANLNQSTILLLGCLTTLSKPVVHSAPAGCHHSTRLLCRLCTGMPWFGELQITPFQHRRCDELPGLLRNLGVCIWCVGRCREFGGPFASGPWGWVGYRPSHCYITSVTNSRPFCFSDC